MVAAYLTGSPAEEWAEPVLAEAWREVRIGRAPDFGEAQFAEIRGRFRSLVHWTTLHGDSADAEMLRRAIARARVSAFDPDPMPDVLDASLRARLALLSADTLSAVRLLEKAASRPILHLVRYYPSISFAPQRMLLAELLAKRGDMANAHRWLDSFTYVGALGDLLYVDRVQRLRSSPGK